MNAGLCFPENESLLGRSGERSDLIATIGSFGPLETTLGCPAMSEGHRRPISQHFDVHVPHAAPLFRRPGMPTAHYP